jgi:hypothetical protein
MRRRDATITILHFRVGVTGIAYVLRLFLTPCNILAEPAMQTPLIWNWVH